MNGSKDNAATTLCWTGKVLSEDDLRRHLTNQNEILLAPTTIVTPLALDFLRSRRISIRRDAAKANEPQRSMSGAWGWAEEKSSGIVAAAVQGLIREGTKLVAWKTLDGDLAQWTRGIAEAIAGTEVEGGIVFCGEPELVACVANKVSGLRAAAVYGPRHATRARKNLGANLLAVEMPGRTVFEVRQILQPTAANCPAPLAHMLQEMDGHAHC